MIKKFKIFELVDYEFNDVSEKETYDGNLYIYSDKPLKQKDINFENERIYVFNRADASDTTSEYIYQIKLKKPLYKKELDFFGFSYDEDKEIDENEYSGYYYRHQITSEWLARITNTKDIINFRYVGGFVKYDTHNPEKLDIKLSEKTESWLYLYIGQGSLMLPKLTDDIIEELKPFRPKKSIKIYKGIEEVQIKYFSKDQPPYKKDQSIISNFSIATSWTTNVLIARRFIDEYPSSPPFVIMMDVDPEDILVDVQKLPEQYYHTNQREIIVLPGKYNYKIVWKGKTN